MQRADAGVKAGVTVAVATTGPFDASLVAAGPGHAVHISFHEKLQSGFRLGAERITAVSLSCRFD